MSVAVRDPLSQGGLYPRPSFDVSETALSFANRLAAFHIGLPTTDFLHDFGIAPMKLVAGEPEALDRLCEISGSEREHVYQNTPVRTGKRVYDLRGHSLPAEFFSRPRTVYCPACLRDDDAGCSMPALARRARWIWALEVVRTCPTHKIPLIRKAKERHDDELNELAVRAPATVDALDAEVSALVPREVSPLQTYVVDRLDGCEGPKHLDRQALDAIVRSAELLGAVILYGPRVNLASLTVDQRDAAGARGFTVLEMGEAQVRSELKALFEACKCTTSNMGPQKVFGRLYTSMNGRRVNEDYGILRRVLREFIFENFALASGTYVLGLPLEARRLHTVASLAGETGLDNRTLRHALVAKGLVPTDAAAGFAFDAEEGRAFAAQVVRKVTVIALPKVLGCSRVTCDQILEERIVTPLADGTMYATGRTRKAVDHAEIDDFLGRLTAASRPVSHEPAEMVSVRKAAEKAKRPASSVLHLVLGGYLENVARLEANGGIDALRVNPEEVKSAVGQISVGMSIGDACRRLHIPIDAGWSLVDFGELPVTRIHSPNAQHFVTRCHLQDVNDLGERLVNAGRIAPLLDIPATEIEAKLRRHRIKPAFRWADVGANLFHRDDVKKFFPI